MTVFDLLDVTLADLGQLTVGQVLIFLVILWMAWQIATVIVNKLDKVEKAYYARKTEPPMLTK